MSDHGVQVLGWKGEFGANSNPPCQHSLWEETIVPEENPGLSVERLTEVKDGCSDECATVAP
jgi:hypothetical protein